MEFNPNIMAKPDEFEDIGPTTPGKTINLYRNGNPDVMIQFKVKEAYDPQEVSRYIQNKFRFKHPNKLILFNSQGMEITPEDFKYLKSDASVFVSKGENFSRSAKLCDYVDVRKLGEGSFGEVKLVAHKVSKQLFAIKFLKKPAKFHNYSVEAAGLDKMFKEAAALKNLRHKHIVEIFDTFTLKDLRIAFVMEYLEGGTLLDYIKKKKKLPEAEARDFFLQIMDAVGYCHSHQVIHCDLKLENILLKSEESKFIKIIDFGIAGFKTHFKEKILGGSVHHMSPEILSGQKKYVDSAIDIWALGCILYEMLYGNWAFRGEDKSKLVEKICKGDINFPVSRSEPSVEAKDLIKKMLEKDPEKRIRMGEILVHPWVNPPEVPKESKGLFQIEALNKFTENLKKDEQPISMKEEYD